MSSTAVYQPLHMDTREEEFDGKIILSEDGDLAPYNGQVEYSINVEKAETLGYEFKHVRDWIYELLDSYILSM